MELSQTTQTTKYFWGGGDCRGQSTISFVLPGKKAGNMTFILAEENLEA